MPGRFGRPGLLGAMARTAAITGTATAVNRSMNRAANQRAQTRADAEAYRNAAPAPQMPQAPPPAAEDDLIAQLARLGDLHASGVLSDDEFATAKAKLLS